MEALSNQIVVAVTFAFLAASVLYLCAWAFKSQFVGRAASVLTWATFAALTVAIILRWVASHQLGIGHAPFSNLFESLVFFAWTLALIYLLIELSTWIRTIGAFAVPLAFLALLYALTLDPAIKPLLRRSSPTGSSPT